MDVEDATLEGSDHDRVEDRLLCRLLRRLVSESGRDCFPSLFSPVEESLVYYCRSTDESAVYVRRTDGSGRRCRR